MLEPLQWTVVAIVAVTFIAACALMRRGSEPLDLKAALLSAGFLSLISYWGSSQLLGNVYALKAPGTFVCRSSLCLQQVPGVNYMHVGLSRPLYHCPAHAPDTIRREELSLETVGFGRPSIASWLAGVVFGALMPGAILVGAVRASFKQKQQR